jgi:hypothetical protein
VKFTGDYSAQVVLWVKKNTAQGNIRSHKIRIKKIFILYICFFFGFSHSGQTEIG